jgi:hypothetical protein
MNARVTAGIVAALVLAGAAVISFVSIAPTKSSEATAATPSSAAPSALPGAAALPAVVIPAAYSTAMMTDCDVEINAVSGTISDLVGNVTKYSERLWTVQRGNLTLVVEKTDNTLTVHFPDETPDTVIEFLAGSASDFMDVVDAVPCSDCTTMACCFENCGSQTTFPYCWCTAHVTCTGGIAHLCWSSTGCAFDCVTP